MMTCCRWMRSWHCSDGMAGTINKMDDETKIRALKVYSEHWGSKQARARRAADGIRQTTAILQRDFDGLRFCDMTGTGFWGCLASSLLDGMNHYTPYEDDTDDFKHLCARARFASDIGASFFSPHVASATEESMRRINALLALPPILTA